MYLQILLIQHYGQDKNKFQDLFSATRSDKRIMFENQRVGNMVSWENNAGMEWKRNVLSMQLILTAFYLPEKPAEAQKP